MEHIDEGPREMEATSNDLELVSKLVPLVIGMNPGKWARVRHAIDTAFDELKCQVTLDDEERVTQLLRHNLG